MAVKLVNMESYTTPKVVESPAKEWVEYGQDNDYYQYLIDRYNGSAVNNAVITGISEMIYGQGLAATDADKKPLDYAKMKMIFKDEDLKKVCLDLKLLGQAAFNIVWNKGKTEVKKAKHIPIQNLRPEKAQNGKINAYYYSNNWKEFRKEQYAPIRIECFDGTRKSSDSQILVIHPYSPGFFYFSPVDYQGSLQWSEIDEEIGNYHLTNIQNGFAPSMMVNFNNGTPNAEEQRAIERKITQKFTSTNGKKFVLSFNDNQSTATTIDPIPISDASEQYKFLSEECTKKILVGHRITSPMLFGVKDNTGLGNNADEIKTASQLFDNTVIRPKQNIILDAISDVLQVNSINLDMYFITLQPLEFTESVVGVDDDTKEKETGVKMAKVATVITDDIELPLYDSVEEAEAEAKRLNGSGYHEHTIDGKVYYMPFNDHDQAKAVIQKLDNIKCGCRNEEEFSKKDKRPFLDDNTSNDLLDELETYGEVNDDDEWELISEELVDTTEDNFHEFKSISDIDMKPTAGMVSEAKKGLEWRREYGRGGTAVGVARARDIANGKNLSESTIKRMYSFFSRHQKSTKGGKGFKPGQEGFPSGGRIAWALWGGDAGFSWSKKKVEEIKRVKEMTGDYAEIFNKMPSSSAAKPNDKSKWGDKGLYKVRYAYSKTASGSAKSPSRMFCTQMIMMADSKIEFRYEDIKRMSRSGVNGDFAPKGRKTYDLFAWKGGVNCYHGWMRRIYFRKQAKGKFLPNEGMKNEKRVGNNPYVKQKGKEAVAPIDTPNKGRLN